MLSVLPFGKIDLSGTYRENGNTAHVKTSFMPGLSHRFPPSLILSFSRRLFRRRLEEASLDFSAGRRPYLTLRLTSPLVSGMGLIDRPNPPSISGTKVRSVNRALGVTFEGVIPKLFGEWAITFSELALQFKVGLEYGFTGVNWVFTGSWSNQTTTVSVENHFTSMSIITKLGFVLLRHYVWMSTEGVV